MRHLLKIFFLLLLCVNVSNATIYIVDNTPGSGIADFTSLQAAHDGASQGDTLYFIGSGTSYGDATLTKRLFIFGPGYFLAENEDTQAATSSAIVGEITFSDSDIGSDGSLITGMFIKNSMKVYAQNIVIKRNRFFLDNYASYSAAIYLFSSANNIMILQNYIQFQYLNVILSSIIISGAGDVTIANNYLYKLGDEPVVKTNDVVYNVDIINNILRGDLDVYNCTIRSNIIIGGEFINNGISNVYLNNIGDADQFGTNNGNMSNVDMSTVFVGTGSTDGYYQLAEGSVAIGAGYGGVDCGMFGGENPYILSGIPNIPTVTFFNAPSTGIIQRELPVEIRVKARP